MKVKVIGAGSIGNHLSQASRRMGWDVTVIDADSKALERMKNDIYPTRYGAWDDSIQLFTSDKEPKGGFDIIMIGTPPHVRMKLALAALDENPKLLHLEKPLCTPDLAGVEEFNNALKNHPNTLVTVGYDNAVGEAVDYAVGIVKKGDVGDILTIDVEFREHWRGIFSAHPWLKGPWETYLGYWQKGGGAGGEHSHALHLWKYFADVSGWNGIKDVKSSFSFNKEEGAEYDRVAVFVLTGQNGKIGRVVQDVVTYPVKKWARFQGDRGFIEWLGNAVPEGDVVRWQSEGNDVVEKVFSKKRPDDFYRQTLHYGKLLSGEVSLKDSPVSYERGLEIMKILSKAYGEARQA